MIADPAIS